jgi:hypothetical protein
MIKQLFLVLCAAAPLACAQTVDKVEVIQVQGAGTVTATATVEASAQAVAEHQVMVVAGGPEMRVSVFPGKALKNAPYAADSTSETVQVLADGNRIVNKQSSKMYRDSEGRTRVENSLAPVGPWVPQNGNFSLTIIDDPVSGEHYTLNNKEKIATKMSFPKNESMTKAFTWASSSAGTISKDVMVGGPAVMTFQRHAEGPFKSPAKEFKSESLGKQTIEGVVCDGTRTTVTIAPGQIGNEREIVIVTESWVSPELGMEILRKHTDPRSGETTYKISNLVRGDQPKSLFEVPADYKLDDVGADVIFHKEIRHESQNKKEE